MQRAWSVIAVVVLGCGSPGVAPPHSQTAAPVRASRGGGSGFDPAQPTLRLPRNFTPTRYTARLEIDPAVPMFGGEIQIEGTLDRASAAIWLNGKHLEVTHATAERVVPDRHEIVPLDVTARGDYLELRPSTVLDAGAWTLKLEYTGEIEQIGFDGAYVTMYGADPYIVTQFESTAARLVFPCVDEPDRKTPWQLTLDVPKGLVAVSNTPATSTTALDRRHDRVVFAPTRPLPSYLVAFAIGPWEIVDAGKAKSGVPIRIVTPRGTAKNVAFLASAEPRIVDILESWFAIPFPYPKLDIVIAPSLRGGAMENAGMITSDARDAMYEQPSAHERFRIVTYIGHETAHQWFGDLVTAAWWDDIWLNESFATWIEDKVLAAFDPSWPSEAQSWRNAFAIDALASTRRIRQPIETDDDIHNAFDAITYPKGGLVLRMLEHMLGEAKFQAAIRGYIAAHADGSATAADVFAALSDANGAPLTKITSSFFDQPGVPELAMTLHCTAGGSTALLAQRRFTSTDAYTLPAEKWTVPVCVAYETATHERAERCTVLDALAGSIPLDGGARCPAWIAPAGTYGYYRARLDAPALEAIRDRAWPLLAPEERVAIYGDAWAQARAGHVPIPLVMGLAEKLRAGSPTEVAAGLGDPGGLGDGAIGLPIGMLSAIPPDLREAARARVRTFVEPLVKKLGLVARRDEDFGAESIRIDALSAALWSRTHVLDAEARRLEPSYRTLRSSSRPAVLERAANADPAVAEQLRVAAFGERDPALREELVDAVASVHDPERHRAMLDKLVGDPRASAEDLAGILVGDRDLDDTAIAEQYVRAHFDDVMKRLPSAENEDFPIALRLIRIFGTACDPAQRDEVGAYLTAHFGSLASAKRPVAQRIEEIDACIAQRKLLEPSLRAWLGDKGGRIR